METITFLDENLDVQTVSYMEVNPSTIRPEFDIHIRSIEVLDGWVELWRCNGVLCGYFETEE